MVVTLVIPWSFLLVNMNESYKIHIISLREKGILEIIGIQKMPKVTDRLGENHRIFDEAHGDHFGKIEAL